ncbi:TetR/AcrR family transcriptional regulator [Streptomyces sp. AK04-3B]|uniref:TetR/AcrR family transcriptional regulator n=1 Tax=unclassified Streptomyces TaxID=2593676 RepID=UPI0029B9FD60|nr:TetR/AcrR family transcriptional regulator [Streptomyces sp. AK04-3B]MDX3801551.1 TetR/AcrR family transcriptional regulator [Streptomyces sp. AK04-3B]
MSSHDTPKPLRADAARNRTRLLDAARHAFTSGQVPVSLKQIARDTGVGIGTLYRHFPTREALVEAIYRHELAQLCADAEALLRTEDPVHALRGWMDRFADYAMTRRETAQALRAVLTSEAETASPAREQLSAAVHTILAAGTATGTLRDDVHAEDVVLTLVGMLATTSPTEGRDQLGRMFDLLMDAVRSRQP